MKQYVKIVLICLFFANNLDINANTIGQINANAATQYFNVSQNVNAAANIIQGFTYLAGGFAFAGGAANNGSIAYNAIGGIGGTITLQGANSMTLTSDLAFLNQTAFTAGSFAISANNKAIIFPNLNSSFTFPQGLSSLPITSAKVVANSYLTIVAPITFLSSGNVLNGNGNYIDLTNGSISVGPGGSLLIQNATIKGVDAGKISCQDNLGTVSLQNIKWVQDATFSFTLGMMDIFNDVLFTGSTIFAYRSTNLLTVHSNSQLMFDIGMTFSYDTTANSRLVFTDATAGMYFNESTLFANSNGLRLTKGNVTFDGPCPVISQGASAANGILIGDNASAANNLLLRIVAETDLNVQSGFFVYQNV
ncbi:MAG: hypothetical protein P4L31_03990 [Candidatus Babeliales bacterium]|nr:hypothetical protein [Candidatus Babeliales bacterium]